MCACVCLISFIMTSRHNKMSHKMKMVMQKKLRQRTITMKISNKLNNGLPISFHCTIDWSNCFVRFSLDSFLSFFHICSTQTKKNRHFYGFTFDISSIIFGVTFSFCFCVRTLSQCPLLTLQRKKKRIIWSIRIISSWQLGRTFIPSIFFFCVKKFQLTKPLSVARIYG